MPTIAVTGATGQLGRLVVAALLDRGVAPQDIVAAVRTPAKAADLADQGIQVRHADYALAETLVPALEGADRVLLISGIEGDPALFMIGVATAAGREEADPDDKRRLHYRGPELASRYRYARKYDPPSYRGSSSQRTTCFRSPGRWRDRRLGPISL